MDREYLQAIAQDIKGVQIGGTHWPLVEVSAGDFRLSGDVAGYYSAGPLAGQRLVVDFDRIEAVFV